jgi:hypothetical protein
MMHGHVPYINACIQMRSSMFKKRSNSLTFEPAIQAFQVIRYYFPITKEKENFN